MPVFISYSHQDREFAEKLAALLVKNKARVWIDRWELNVGDSIIEKIQSAIKSASALLVVLSKASVGSEWCKKELNAGLMRELEERRVLVLPILLEKCEIPMFLRDKKYADFRTNFDEGLRDTLDGIAAVTSDTQGRIDTPEYHSDWGADWGTLSDGRFALRFTFVDHSERLPYSVITEVNITCNERLTRRLLQYESDGRGWLGRLIIVFSLNEAAKREGVSTVILADSQPKSREVNFVDAKMGFDFKAIISSRRLGTDNGFNILMDWSRHLHSLLDDLSREVPEEGRARLRQRLGFE